MNSMHDLGGRHGFGPIDIIENEPVFRAEWERRMFGIFILASNSGFFNVDQFRHSIENMDPVHYLSSPYYEHWLEALLFHADRLGVTAGEGSATAPDSALNRFPLDKVDDMVRTGANYHAQAKVEPRFKAGDRITVRNINPIGHTRLPAYVRGKSGRVEKDFGVYVFPDTMAHDRGEKPQHLYNVIFQASELWGSDTPNPADTLVISMFEDYITKAGE